MTARQDTTNLPMGHFQAKYLWPLLPFAKYAREVHPLRLFNGPIGLEPCAEGGAYLSAFTGHACVIVRDPLAEIRAAVTLDIPDAAFKAAKGIEMPDMTHEGEPFEVTAPEWMQPGEVLVTGAGIVVCPKMRNPAWAEESDTFQPDLYSRIASVRDHTRGIDYRMTAGSPVNWRLLTRGVKSNTPLDYATIAFNPKVPALFGDLAEMLRGLDREKQQYPAIHHTTSYGTNGYSTVVQFLGHPDILGFWAHTAHREPPAPIPDHFFDEPATEG